MTTRTNPYKAAPATMKALIALEEAARASGIEESLRHLVKTRASQINRCAYCIHMHTTEARATGESDARLHLLAAWRESPLYTARERAALAWTEALTELPAQGAPDEVYAELQAHFTPEEESGLTLVISAINAWNRFGVGFAAQHPVRAEDRRALDAA